MKKYLFLLLIVTLAFSGVIYAAKTDTIASENDIKTVDDQELDKSEANSEEAKSKVPDSAAMTLGMADKDEDGKENENSKFVMPATFRGGDPDSSLVHVLEDVEYQKHEHSIIYSEDPNDVALGSKFETEPNITWTTSKKNENGDFDKIKEDKTNMASHGGAINTPGEYQIGNSGSRNVSEPVEEVTKLEDDTDKDKDKEEKDDKDDKAKTVTAQQTMGVIVHDCTPPDLWVAFQEDAGNIDMAESEFKLKEKIYDQIKNSLGRPLSPNDASYEETSYIFVDEGSNEERDRKPWEKTSSLTIAGPMFNEYGSVVKPDKSKVVKTSFADEEKVLVKTSITVNKKDKEFKGIFVRRNVPFVFAAIAVDNTDERKVPTEVVAQIEYSNGDVVEKQEGECYMFRVPNYPRSEYKDQPEYYFYAKAVDKAGDEEGEGNYTEIKIPVYVVNSAASFEVSNNK